MTELAAKIRLWALELYRKKRLMAAAVLAAVMLTLIAAVVGHFLIDRDRRSFESCLSQATAAYQAGDYDSALSLLRRAESISHSEECLMLMADCYEAQGNLEKAVEILRQMDTGDRLVAQRITSMERRRIRQENAQMVTVAGQQVSPSVQALELDGLELTDAMLDSVKQLRRVDSLSLQNNRLTDISALSSLSTLVNLQLAGNGIEDISPLGQLAGLRTLYLDNNPVGDLSPLYTLKDLSLLSVTGLALSEEQLTELTQALPNCAILADDVSRDLTVVMIGGVSFRSDVKSLDLSGLGLRDITVLAICRELENLDISGNEISDLSALMEHSSLERLNISDNLISDLRPLMGLNTLRWLNASGNLVADTAAAGGIMGLRYLNLSENPLTDLHGLAKLENLRTLKLHGCNLNDGHLEGLMEMSHLSQMELEDNPALSGEAVDELKKTLYLCDISHSELAYTSVIGGVSLRWDVTALELSGLGLSEMDWFSRFYNLETVDLSDNEISNIYVFPYSRSRTTIKTVDLSGNRIEDITPLAYLSGLETLDLRNNQIGVLMPLYVLKELKCVYLDGNPLSWEEIERLCEALPDCQVIFGE